MALNELPKNIREPLFEISVKTSNGILMDPLDLFNRLRSDLITNESFKSLVISQYEIAIRRKKYEWVNKAKSLIEIFRHYLCIWANRTLITPEEDTSKSQEDLGNYDSNQPTETNVRNFKTSEKSGMSPRNVGIGLKEGTDSFNRHFREQGRNDINDDFNFQSRAGFRENNNNFEGRNIMNDDNNFKTRGGIVDYDSQFEGRKFNNDGGSIQTRISDYDKQLQGGNYMNNDDSFQSRRRTSEYDDQNVVTLQARRMSDFDDQRELALQSRRINDNDDRREFALQANLPESSGIYSQQGSIRPERRVVDNNSIRLGRGLRDSNQQQRTGNEHILSPNVNQGRSAERSNTNSRHSEHVSQRPGIAFGQGVDILQRNTGLSTMDIQERNIGMSGMDVQQRNARLTGVNVRQENIGLSAVDIQQRDTVLSGVNVRQGRHGNAGLPGMDVGQNNIGLADVSMRQGNAGLTSVNITQGNAGLSVLNSTQGNAGLSDAGMTGRYTKMIPDNPVMDNKQLSVLRYRPSAPQTLTSESVGSSVSVNYTGRDAINVPSGDQGAGLGNVLNRNNLYMEGMVGHTEDDAMIGDDESDEYDPDQYSEEDFDYDYCDDMPRDQPQRQDNAGNAGRSRQISGASDRSELEELERITERHGKRSRYREFENRKVRDDDDFRLERAARFDREEESKYTDKRIRIDPSNRNDAISSNPVQTSKKKRKCRLNNKRRHRLNEMKRLRRNSEDDLYDRVYGGSRGNVTKRDDKKLQNTSEFSSKHVVDDYLDQRNKWKPVGGESESKSRSPTPRQRVSLQQPNPADDNFYIDWLELADRDNNNKQTGDTGTYELDHPTNVNRSYIVDDMRVTVGDSSGQKQALNNQPFQGVVNIQGSKMVNPNQLNSSNVGMITVQNAPPPVMMQYPTMVPGMFVRSFQQTMVMQNPQITPHYEYHSPNAADNNQMINQNPQLTQQYLINPQNAPVNDQQSQPIYWDEMDYSDEVRLTIENHVNIQDDMNHRQREALNHRQKEAKESSSRKTETQKNVRSSSRDSRSTTSSSSKRKRSSSSRGNDRQRDTNDKSKVIKRSTDSSKPVGQFGIAEAIIRKREKMDRERNARNVAHSSANDRKTGKIVKEPTKGGQEKSKASNNVTSSSKSPGRPNSATSNKDSERSQRKESHRVFHTKFILPGGIHFPLGGSKSARQNRAIARTQAERKLFEELKAKGKNPSPALVQRTIAVQISEGFERVFKNNPPSYARFYKTIVDQNTKRSEKALSQNEATSSSNAPLAPHPSCNDQPKDMTTTSKDVAETRRPPNNNQPKDNVTPSRNVTATPGLSNKIHTKNTDTSTRNVPSGKELTKSVKSNDKSLSNNKGNEPPMKIDMKTGELNKPNVSVSSKEKSNMSADTPGHSESVSQNRSKRRKSQSCPVCGRLSCRPRRHFMQYHLPNLYVNHKVDKHIAEAVNQSLVFLKDLILGPKATLQQLVAKLNADNRVRSGYLDVKEIKHVRQLSSHMRWTMPNFVSIKPLNAVAGLYDWRAIEACFTYLDAKKIEQFITYSNQLENKADEQQKALALSKLRNKDAKMKVSTVVNNSNQVKQTAPKGQSSKDKQVVLTKPTSNNQSNTGSKKANVKGNQRVVHNTGETLTIDVKNNLKSNTHGKKNKPETNAKVSQTNTKGLDAKNSKHAAELENKQKNKPETVPKVSQTNTQGLDAKKSKYALEFENNIQKNTIQAVETPIEEDEVDIDLDSFIVLEEVTEDDESNGPNELFEEVGDEARNDNITTDESQEILSTFGNLEGTVALKDDNIKDKETTALTNENNKPLFKPHSTNTSKIPNHHRCFVFCAAGDTVPTSAVFRPDIIVTNASDPKEIVTDDETNNKSTESVETVTKETEGTINATEVTDSNSTCIATAEKTRDEHMMDSNKVSENSDVVEQVSNAKDDDMTKSTADKTRGEHITDSNKVSENSYVVEQVSNTKDDEKTESTAAGDKESTCVPDVDVKVNPVTEISSSEKTLVTNVEKDSNKELKTKKETKEPTATIAESSEKKKIGDKVSSKEVPDVDVKVNPVSETSSGEKTLVTNIEKDSNKELKTEKEKKETTGTITESSEKKKIGDKVSSKELPDVDVKVNPVPENCSGGKTLVTNIEKDSNKEFQTWKETKESIANIAETSEKKNIGDEVSSKEVPICSVDIQIKSEPIDEDPRAEISTTLCYKGTPDVEQSEQTSETVQAGQVPPRADINGASSGAQSSDVVARNKPSDSDRMCMMYMYVDPRTYPQNPPLLNIKYSVGVKPKHASHFQSKMDNFETLISKKAALALGPVGLDFSEPPETWECQEEVFKAALDFCSVKKVLMLSLTGLNNAGCSAYSKALEIVGENCGSKQPMLLQNFSGSQHDITAWSSEFKNCYFELNPRGETLSADEILILKSIPVARLILKTNKVKEEIGNDKDTDSESDIIVMSLGKDLVTTGNEHIVNAIAKELNMSVDDLIEKCYENMCRLFPMS